MCGLPLRHLIWFNIQTNRNPPLRRIAILGSTGSIGRQALDVIAAHPDRFRVQVLTAGNNVRLLAKQALLFHPVAVVIGNPASYQALKEALAGTSISVFAGHDAIAEVVCNESINLVLSALVGYAGLMPAISAIQSGKNIALANKETLVVAGELITALAKKHGVTILPVDSEHSALFQCLEGERMEDIEKIILTASGGPFRGMTAEQLKTVTRDQALQHPNWSMGNKITIDSATLMNKGLEVIEARWLFGLEPNQIDVVVHPQSIIHSMVQFVDGSIKAQMGLPDMRLPIQYALAYPGRLPGKYPGFTWTAFRQLTFEPADTKTFRNLALAYEALNQGGNMPCILNAANEVAVDRFLSEKLSFHGITELVERCMAEMPFIPGPSLEDYEYTDRETRKFAASV